MVKYVLKYHIKNMVLGDDYEENNGIDKRALA